MMNTVNLIGRLTKDVELRYTQSGRAVANITLAANHYELIQTTDEYPFVIVSTSYVNPLPYIFEIKDTLLENNFKGFVLVDLLLSNGFTENRFLKVYFDGSNFDILNSEIENHISSELLNVVYSFYIEKPELIENNNILPKAQKHLLLKGSLIKH